MTQVCCCCPCIHDLLMRTTRRVRMEDEAHERERHAAELQSRLNAGSAPHAEDYFKQHDSYTRGDATTTLHSRIMAESSRAATTTTKAERQLERQRLLSERAALSDGPTPRSPSSRDHTYRGAASRGLQLYETFMAAFRDAISSPRSKRATGPWSSFKWDRPPHTKTRSSQISAARTITGPGPLWTRQAKNNEEAQRLRQCCQAVAFATLCTLSTTSSTTRRPCRDMVLL